MSPSSGAASVSAGWRRNLPRRRQMLWGLLVAFIASVVLVGIGYATTPIPNPSSFATAQATTLYYSDGKTVLARLGSTTRIDVSLKQVPVDVQHAVLAAEDRQFYSEPGISPTGILRALWTDIRGGEISQGGSTITQQYVKNAYLTSERTFTRKFKEIFIAVKLANSRSKDEILKDYLNTIYFGRGAYGIQAASRAYFGKDVSELNASEGAVLAATISQPSYYDPAVNKPAAKARWQYVIDGMEKKNWLRPDEAAGLHYPHVVSVKQRTGSSCTGPTGFICQAVRAELNQHGFDDARLSLGGYRVVTTIDKDAQEAAVTAETDNNGDYQSDGVDKGRESALVSVEPGDGAIRAMYGGANFCPSHKHPDSCTDLTGVASNYARPPGSSFKPYTLIAALKQDIGLDSTYPGPESIEIDGATIHNSEGETCGACTLTEALAKSINTIFVPLADQVGPDKVVEAAYDAGIPKSRDLNPVPAITLGTDDVSPLDQAVGYATIAAQGVRAEPYLVDRVETQKQDVVYRAKTKTERVFDADVMADTTFAMTKVFDCAIGGTACGRALTDRPVAGKTGTNGDPDSDGNLDAWFVGVTPQLSTAVWYGNSDRHTPVTSNGVPVYGADLPALTWQQMMAQTMSGAPVEAFPPPANVGSPEGTVTTPPTPTKTPTESPSETPSETPSEVPTTVSPTATPTLVPTKTKSPPPSNSPTPTQSASADAAGSPAPG